MKPIDFIEQAAQAVEGVSLCSSSQNPRSLHADVVIHRADDRAVTFALEVVEIGDTVMVRERAPRLLPAYCPERHINHDGGFCLGFDEPFLRPTSAERGGEWWLRVRGYLENQLDAALLRRWPGGVEWKHGAAATWQKRLEHECADDAALLASVRAIARRSRRPPTRDDPCPCGSARPLIQCHGVRVTRLIELARSEREAEREFWSGSAGSVACCGTIDGCPLKGEGTSDG